MSCFDVIQVSFSSFIIVFKFVLVDYSRLGGMCAGPDARRNHGWQRHFRQSDCRCDDLLLRRDLTAPPHRCPGHRWGDVIRDDHGAADSSSALAFQLTPALRPTKRGRCTSMPQLAILLILLIPCTNLLRSDGLHPKRKQMIYGPSG